MAKNYSKIIPIDLYRRGVFIFIGEKDDFFKDKNAKRFLTDEVRQTLDDIDFSKTAAVTLRTGTDAIIYAPSKPYEDEFVHELSHATFYILKLVDIDPTICEEAYAYLLEYLYYKAMLWFNALEQADAHVQ